MTQHPRNVNLRRAAWALVAAVLLTQPCLAQSSSLLTRAASPGEEPGIMLDRGSLIFQTLPSPLGREIRLHDLITIRVDQKSQMLSEGEVQRRKNALYDAILADWLRLDGLRSIKPSPQSDGDPRVNGQLTQLFRAEGEIETRESLVFDITAKVADIRPNGNIVLEAHRTVRSNNEVWEYSLTGICRRQDIDPGNVVLSKHIADLDIFKRERGHVRDSYRRGWFTRWFDQFDPF